MAELSKEQLEEIIARVTANVLREIEHHESARLKAGEVRIELTHLTKPGEEVSWAPWTVALPPEIRIEMGKGSAGPRALAGLPKLGKRSD